VGSLLLHALRALGLLLGSWLIHQPLKIPYSNWIGEIIIETVAALLVSLLFVQKLRSPKIGSTGTMSMAKPATSSKMRFTAIDAS
jgi:hypothetical protein